MLIKSISKVPDELFASALEQINLINWSIIQDPRKNNPIFTASTAIHLRVPSPPSDIKPVTVAEWSKIIPCENANTNYTTYDKVVNCANWMLAQVKGVALGRIMIIELAPGGSVRLHIDPFDYFDHYSRFHIPFKTNKDVVFNGGPGTLNEHMEYQHLYQLNNKLPHALENNSELSRIHLLVDIAVLGGNKIF